MNHNIYNVPEDDSFYSWVKKGLEFSNNPSLHPEIGKGKTLITIYLNSSLRTRLSTNKAGQLLGMNVIDYSASSGYALEINVGAVMNQDTAEHIKEAAKVISRYADVIAIRSFPKLVSLEDDLQDQIVTQFMQFAEVPVINLESCLFHPLQGLADVITIEQHKKKPKPKVVLTWAPHPKALPLAVPISVAQSMLKMDYDFTIVHPEGFDLPREIVGSAEVLHNQDEALRNADFVYAKSWSSTQNYGKPVSKYDWMIDLQKMSLTNSGRFMHCLPIRRNVVALDGVLDDPKALIYEQAQNRVHAAQSAIFHCLNTEV